LKGTAIKLRQAGKCHIITCKTEHHATLSTCEFLEKQGFHVTYLDVDSYGSVDPEAVKKVIKKDTGLITLMFVNNEVGTINPISDISKIAKENRIIFHTDAVQAFGKIPVNVDELGVDLLSLSAHKIYGPKGVGIIYVRRGIEIENLIHGGGQERGRRAGTENVAFAVGFAKAAQLICTNRESENKRMRELNNTIRRLLSEKFSYIEFNGHPDKSLPNILSVSFDSKKIEIDGEALLMNLDLAGIAVSSGSACTSGSFKPSHVLLAMGKDEASARATIRFSFGSSTSVEEIIWTVGKLEEIVKKIGREK